MDVIPSPSTSKTDVENASLKVITRSKAVKDAQAQTDGSGESSRQVLKCKNRRKQRSKKAEKTKETKAAEPKKPSKKPKETKEELVSTFGTSFGGSIIVDKVFEPLQAALDAYNNRIAALAELPKKLQEYPNPREEKVNLVVHQQIIHDTQTLWEGPPPVIMQRPVSFTPNLETIPEATPSMEKGSTVNAQPPFEEEPFPDLEPNYK